MLSARSPKNIKISTFEKAWKSSHFRSDNQRQISLDLSHTCRVRKRLISLINFATFFEIIRLARCEYSKLVSVYSFPKENVLVFEEGCAFIQRGVFVSLPLKYCDVYRIFYVLSNFDHVFFCMMTIAKRHKHDDISSKLDKLLDINFFSHFALSLDFQIHF
jgi:hypothetical protein